MNPTTDTRQRQRKSLNPNDNKKTHTMMDTNEEMKRPSSHRHRSYRLNSSHVKLSHLDPELVTSDSDSESDELKIEEELARKRTKLQQIDKQIRLQKTTDAMKTTRPFLKAKKPSQMLKEERKEDLSHSKVESSVKNTQPFMTTLEKDVGVSSGEWSSTYNNRPLKETVNGILQQRWPDGVLATAKALSTPSDHPPSPNPVEKTHTSTLSEDDHPLKLRVKALMNRHCYSGSLDSHGEVPVVKAPPSCESPSTTVTENNLVVKGFQRFLSVLNNGVDIEMLTKMVNDNHERPLTGQELLHSQTRVVKEKSDVCKIESQQLQRGAGQRDRRSCSKERKTKLLNQDLSNGGRKRNIQPEEKSSQGDDGGSRHSGSSRRSRSPPVVEEKKPKLVQHQEDLQNILKTIGFSLDADDMCKLEERTQERLYGIKHDTKQRLDSTGVSKRIQQHVQSDQSHSLSSTSISVSPISSPSRNQHSHSKTIMDSREQTQSSEYLHFTQRSRERGREQGREQDVDGDKNRIASRDGSSDCHQYPENQEYLVTYPDAASAIPSYTSVQQHSEYTAYHSDTSNSASLNYGSNDIQVSSSYPPGFCNSVNPVWTSADNGALLDHVYPHPQPLAGCNDALGHSYLNSDLSQSEGQTGQRSGSHYLHIINSKKTTGIVNKMSKKKNKQLEFVSINSINPVWTSADTEAFLAKNCAQRDPSLIIDHRKWLINRQRAVRKSINRVKSNLVIMINPEEAQKILEKLAEREQDIQNILEKIPSNCASLSYGSNDIPPSSSSTPGFCNYSLPSADTGALFRQVYHHPKPPAGYNDAIGHFKKMAKQKEGLKESQRSTQRQLLEVQLLTEEEINANLTKKEQNPDLSLSEGQTGHQAAVNTVTKPKFQREEKKMAEQKEGQKESKISIQGQQLEVELPTEEIINANPTKKEQNSHLSLSEGQTGQRSGSQHLNKISRRRKKEIKWQKRKNFHLINARRERNRLRDQLGIRISKHQVNCDHLINSEEKLKLLEKLARVDQNIKRLEEEINADRTKKEQNPDLSLSEGQMVKDLRAINQVQEELSKLMQTAKYKKMYIRRAELNRENYSEAQQQNSLKHLKKKQQRIDFLIEEKSRCLKALMTQRESKPGPSSCEATALPTAPRSAGKPEEKS